jgi:hypothetical protein
MAFSVARLGYEYRMPEPIIQKDNLRHQLAMAKYQAQREIDWRVEQKVSQLKKDALHAERIGELQHVRQQIRRKDFHVAGYALGICFAYFFGYFATFWCFA